MKKNIVLAITISFVFVNSQAYFWENWGQPQTQEQIEKREIDLKHQKKITDIEYKQRKEQVGGADKLRKKQIDLERKKDQVELDRKIDRLNVDR